MREGTELRLGRSVRHPGWKGWQGGHRGRFRLDHHGEDRRVRGRLFQPLRLRALLEDAHRRGCGRIFCLGDLGGFGAEPEALWPLLVEGGVDCIAGNYDVAIGRGDDDCGCGYPDRRDNDFARIAYEYTRAHTSQAFAAWMRGLPADHRETIGGVDLHMVHGSPIAVNDFFWESLSDDEMRERMAASGADVVLCTHSGLPWVRHLDGRTAVNVGVIGRPANDGRREVRYAVVELAGGRADVTLVPLAYDWGAQAASVRAAGLPEPFAETIESGWWTTCLQVLPPPERSRGRYHLYRSELAPGADDDGLGDPPDGDGDRPVVAIFGTSLFPRRLRLTKGATAIRNLGLLLEEAIAEGFVDIRVVSDRDGHGAVAPALTVADDGSYWWATAAAPSDRLADPGMALHEVKRLVVQRLLASGQAAGSLPRAYGCVA